MNKFLLNAITFLKCFRIALLCPPGAFSIGVGSLLYPTTRIHISSKKKGTIKIGDRCLIRGELLTFGHGGIIRIGDDCYLGRDSYIWSAKEINISDRVLISHNVNIYDNLTHPISAKARFRQFGNIRTIGQPKVIDLDEKPVRIEQDALIGAASIIGRGVLIGKGAIVGAGSVVTHDVPAWTIVAGNPAQIIREIPLNER